MLARSCCRIFSTLNFFMDASIFSRTWSKLKDVAFEKRMGLMRATTKGRNEGDAWDLSPRRSAYRLACPSRMQCLGVSSSTGPKPFNRIKP